jgi:beta-N-acetylhexosaminidase
MMTLCDLWSGYAAPRVYPTHRFRGVIAIARPVADATRCYGRPSHQRANPARGHRLNRRTGRRCDVNAGLERHHHRVVLGAGPSQTRRRRAGGVFFVKENVGSLEDVRSLVRLFSAKATPLIAIDHEGGWVQRLTERHGVSRLPTAQKVADSLSPDRAQALYFQAGSEIARLGFTLNLAPVVDLHDPTNPAIGHFGRAFDADPVRVLAYARAFVDGFAEAGVLCALKHFPGNGHTLGDSHQGPADGSNWSERDLAPFAQLIAAGRARLIMAGHAQIPSLEPRPVPVSLSEPVIRGLLRQRLNFNGVAMTDDLDMQAVSSLMPRRDAVIKAVSAGNDLLMIRNVGDFDSELPHKVVAWVREAIAAGTLSRAQIAQAADRVRGLQGLAPAVSFR